MVIFAAVMVFFGACYLFIIIGGKYILARKLKELTHQNVSIESFRIKPFINIEIRNLEIENTAKIERISLSPSLPFMLFGNIAFNSVKIKAPQINYERKVATAAPNGSISSGDNHKEKPLLELLGFNKLSRWRLICRRLVIEDGKLTTIDHSVGPQGVRITVEGLNVEIKNLYSFPFQGSTSFNLSGTIPWQEGREKGKISLEGWLNLFKKDMQATLKIEDIDGIYLYPYYSKWVDLDKARIERANLNFSSDIRGINNDVTATCHLELTDIVRRPLTEGEGEEKASMVTNTLLDMFRALDQGKIVLNFTVRTKLDRPEFGFSNIKAAFEQKVTQARGKGAAIKDVLVLPGRLMDSGIKSTGDFLKGVIDGTVAIGNELRKALLGMVGKNEK